MFFFFGMGAFGMGAFGGGRLRVRRRRKETRETRKKKKSERVDCADDEDDERKFSYRKSMRSGMRALALVARCVLAPDVPIDGKRSRMGRWGANWRRSKGHARGRSPKEVEFCQSKREQESKKIFLSCSSLLKEKEKPRRRRESPSLRAQAPHSLRTREHSPSAPGARETRGKRTRRRT